MKKVGSPLIILTILLLVTGCSSNSTINENKNEPPLASEQFRQTPEVQKNNEKVIHYGLTKSTYIDKGIKISYPQITNLENGPKQDNLNTIIKTEALKGLNFYKVLDKNLNLEIDYKVTSQGSNLLSIQYSGLGYLKDSAYPNNLFYTTNIDINKEKKTRLKDFININMVFVEKFRKGNYKSWSQELNQEVKTAIVDELNNTNDDSLINFFNNADSLDDIGLKEQNNIFTYFTEDSLGVSIGVHHALGDHAEFEIGYKDLGDLIKKDSNIWKDFK